MGRTTGLIFCLLIIAGALMGLAFISAGCARPTTEPHLLLRPVVATCTAIDTKPVSGSCGERHLSSGYSCVLCRDARKCIDGHRLFYCVDDRACDDTACVK